jgi:hypothetical protein
VDGLAVTVGVKRACITDGMEIYNGRVMMKVEKNETEVGLLMMFAGLSEQPCGDQ